MMTAVVLLAEGGRDMWKQNALRPSSYGYTVSILVCLGHRYFNRKCHHPPSLRRTHTFTPALTDLLLTDTNASPLEVLGKPNLFPANKSSRSTPWRVPRRFDTDYFETVYPSPPTPVHFNDRTVHPQQCLGLTFCGDAFSHHLAFSGLPSADINAPVGISCGSFAFRPVAPHDSLVRCSVGETVRAESVHLSVHPIAVVAALCISKQHCFGCATLSGKAAVRR